MSSEPIIPSEVSALLAAVDALPDAAKSAALMHINSRLQARLSESLQVPTLPKAHSCHICTRFVLHMSHWPTPMSDVSNADSDVIDFTSEKIVLTKETLRQGLTQRCTLIEWIYSELARDLRSVESELAQHVRDVQLTAQGTTDHLFYISGNGVSAEFSSSQEFDEMAICLRYEVEPFLVDRLWDRGIDLRRGRSYELFEGDYNAIAEITFRLSAAPDDPSAKYIRNRPARESLTPESRLTLAKNFREDCERNHASCRPTPSILPSRVIDLGCKSPIKSVTLRWSEDGETGQYTALSYCWGGLQPLCTTFSTAQDFTDGIQVSQLPKTIQDAIIVTQHLGFRYLWVDSLCIVQDDPQDLNREIANMANIYQGASVAISAASATSVIEGFLNNPRSRPSSRVNIPCHLDEGKRGSVFIEQRRGHNDQSEDPINLRAWTLQEHILPRRMLVFATKELWWICERGAQSDKTEKLNPNDLNAIQQKRTLDRFSLKSWRKIIRDYTKRFSTYPQDKLPAVAGVASLYSQHLLSRYLAGLWECDFFSELLWCSDRCDISRPLIERAPSWSWVSVDGAINHRWCEVNSELSLSLLSCEVTPVSTSSPYGAVIPGRCSLQVEGCLARVSWGDRRTYIYADIHHLETDPSRKRKFSDTLDQENAFRKVGRTQADAAHEEHIEDVFVLPITSDPVRGLLLQHVRGDTYRRVGLVQRLWDVSILVVSNVQRITII